MQPPLTPMIDVMFQLLLFILLTSTFRQAEGQLRRVAAPGAGGRRAGSDHRPADSHHCPARRRRHRAAYHLDDGAAPLADAQALYRELAARRQAYGSDEVPVAIQPRWDVPWQYVVEADNQAHRAGFKSVGIVSAP